MRTLLIQLTETQIEIATLEDKRLAQLIIHQREATKIGQVIMGRIRTIMPGNFAFIDIGTGKNAFANFKKNHKHITGQPILVQVQKDAAGKKGPYVTEEIALKGWLVVLHQQTGAKPEVGVSHKIKDEAETRRLKKLGRKLLPPGYSAILRTNAKGATEEALAAEIETLHTQLEGVLAKSPYALPPAVLYAPSPITGLLPDVLNDGIGQVVISAAKPGEITLVAEHITSEFPALAGAIHSHTEERSLFAAHGVNKQITAALAKEVPLPCGGFITVEETEACAVIDVNTGNNLQGDSYTDTVLATNLEAAKVAMEQIILRNLSGIIIIDFIDMASKHNEGLLMEAMRAHAGADPLNPLVLDITALGLVQIARPKRRLSLGKILLGNCSYCGGTGLVR